MHAHAFVLAAGFGTRLRPLTLDRPKPLVPVCGVPALAYSLALCARHGLTEVIVNAHHLADQLEAWEGAREGCTVRVSVERPEILGTGGGLKAVADQLCDRFVVLNADVLHTVDLTALRAAIPTGGGVMALRPDPTNARSYGIVAADDSGRVVQLVTLAEATPQGAVHLDTHFTGIHALDRDALRHVPEGFACVVRTAYQHMVPLRQVAALRYEGPWLDAGDPDAYLDANLDLLWGRVQLALDPFARAGWWVGADGRAHGDVPRGVIVDGPCWVGPGASVERGARLAEAVVGHDATVPAGADLRQTVVWDGAVAPPSPLRRAVVHDRGTWQAP